MAERSSRWRFSAPDMNEGCRGAKRREAINEYTVPGIRNKGEQRGVTTPRSGADPHFQGFCSIH